MTFTPRNSVGLQLMHFDEMIPANAAFFGPDHKNTSNFLASVKGVIINGTLDVDKFSVSANTFILRSYTYTVAIKHFLLSLRISFEHKKLVEQEKIR